MTRSKRVLVLFVVVEVLLAAIMVALIVYVQSQALPGTRAEETLRPIQRIAVTLGGIMGALGAFLLIFSWLLRRRGA